MGMGQRQKSLTRDFNVKDPQKNNAMTNKSNRIDGKPAVHTSVWGEDDKKTGYDIQTQPVHSIQTDLGFSMVARGGEMAAKTGFVGGFTTMSIHRYLHTRFLFYRRVRGG